MNLTNNKKLVVTLPWTLFVKELLLVYIMEVEQCTWEGDEKQSFRSEEMLSVNAVWHGREVFVFWKLKGVFVLFKQTWGDVNVFFPNI